MRQTREHNRDFINNLFVALLKRTVRDARQGNEEAKRFLKGPGLKYWCSLVGISPDIIRKNLNKININMNHRKDYKREKGCVK